MLNWKALARAALLWSMIGHAPIATARADELRILTHPLPPFTIGKPDALDGLAVEITKSLLKRTGTSADINVEPFPRLLQDVQNGPMTVGFIVARTPAREPLMQWVGPLVVSGVYLYKKAGSPVVATTLDDARKLGSIGVTRGDADDTYLRAQGFTNLMIGESQSQDIRKVQLGRADVTPMSELVFASVVSELGFKPQEFEKTGVKLYDSAVYAAFSRDVPPAVIASWAAALDEMKKSGEHAAILARYGIMAAGS